MSIRCKSSLPLPLFSEPRLLIPLIYLRHTYSYCREIFANESIEDLIPTSVINFIYDHEVYNVKLPINGHERNPSGSRKPTPLPSPRSGGMAGPVDGADTHVDGAAQGTK